MHEIRNIMVWPAALEMRDPSIVLAMELAGRARVALTIVVDGTQDRRHQAELSMCSSARDELDELRESLAVEGVSSSEVVVFGKDQADLVVDQLRQRRSGLLIKMTRPEELPRSRFISAAIPRLLRASPCPVWVVREASSAAPRLLLAAISPWHYERGLSRLDRQVVDFAVQLADLRDTPLHVVSAWAAPAAWQVRSHCTVDEFRRYIREQEWDVRRRVKKFLRRYGGRLPASNIHVRQGTPAEAITAIADELGADAMVVGSAGRSGISRFILGNTCEAVLRHSTRALLAVCGSVEEDGEREVSTLLAS